MTPLFVMHFTLKSVESFATAVHGWSTYWLVTIGHLRWSISHKRLWLATTYSSLIISWSQSVANHNWWPITIGSCRSIGVPLLTTLPHFPQGLFNQDHGLSEQCRAQMAAQVSGHTWLKAEKKVFGLLVGAGNTGFLKKYIFWGCCSLMVRAARSILWALSSASASGPSFDGSLLRFSRQALPLVGWHH